MSIIRLAALDALADCIAGACPELAGRICAGPAESGTRLSMPSLGINPIRWKFFPDQMGVNSPAEETSSTAVYNVGRHEAVAQLRLGAESVYKRAELEHAISQLFLKREGAPGILLIQVPDCHNASIVYEYEDDQWQNELVFDNELYSIITITIQAPALVEFEGIYNITDLRLSFVGDVFDTFAEIPTADIETVLVASDGSISPAP